MSAPDTRDFAVTVTISNDGPVLGVCGELDAFTSFDLAAILNAVLDRGHLAVALDLSEVDYIDNAGIAVLTRAAARLGDVRGLLTVRSAAPGVLRRLSLTTPHQSLLIEEPAEGPDLGPQGPPSQSSNRQLRTVSGFPASDDVVDSALQLVVTLARATVGGADGASVSLRRHGVLTTVAATDQTITAMDADQYATGERPCVDASVEGRWFHAAALATETRWPRFTPRAFELGINAILSSPLIARDRPVGALNIYSRTAEAFEPANQELAAVFAREASTILSRAGHDVTDAELSARVHEALRTRQVIAQAQGIVMERHGLSADQAYRALREFSRQSNQPLKERAADLVASTTRHSPEEGQHH